MMSSWMLRRIEMGGGQKPVAFPFLSSAHALGKHRTRKRWSRSKQWKQDLAQGGEERSQWDSISRHAWGSNKVHQGGWEEALSQGQLTGQIWGLPVLTLNYLSLTWGLPWGLYTHLQLQQVHTHLRTYWSWGSQKNEFRSGFSLGVLTRVQRPEIRIRVKTHSYSKSFQQ